jgi:hypothetical protein
MRQQLTHVTRYTELTGFLALYLHCDISLVERNRFTITSGAGNNRMVATRVTGGARLIGV